MLCSRYDSKEDPEYKLQPWQCCWCLNIPAYICSACCCPCTAGLSVINLLLGKFSCCCRIVGIGEAGLNHDCCELCSCCSPPTKFA